MNLLTTGAPIDEEMGITTCKEQRQQSEIAMVLDNFSNLLKKIYGLSDNDISAIRWIINKDENLRFMPESCLFLESLNLNDNDGIKSLIWNDLLEKYARKVDDEKAILSSYLIKSIIDSGDFHEISHVTNLFQNFYRNIGPSGLRGLSLDEIKEILKKLIIYYNDYNNKNNGSTFINSNIKTVEELKRILKILEDFNSSKNQMDFFDLCLRDYLLEFSKLHNGENHEKLNLVVLIKDLFNLENSNFSSNLFFEFKKYPELRWLLMKNIGKFKGLNDLDYIDFYLYLYPNRKTTNLKSKPDEVINDCINQLDDIGTSKTEIKSFIDLIKTTQYWTDDVSSRCYKMVSQLSYYVIENYAMGYFNKDVVNEKLINDLINYIGSGKIEKYLPALASDGFEDYINKIINAINGRKYKYNTDFSSIQQGFELMKNRERIGKGGRGIISPYYEDEL